MRSINDTPLAGQVKEYMETEFMLLKYGVVDKASIFLAKMATDLSIILIISVTFLIGSITLAIFAGNLLNSAWGGFGCITLLFFVFLLSACFLKNWLQNKLIGIFYKIFKKRK